MNTHYSRSEKLRNASKIVAGVIGGGGALLFIITLIVAGSFGGITFWAFLAAAVPCTIYIFLAWLAYHLINIISDTFDNTNKILKKIDLLQVSPINAKSNERAPVTIINNIDPEPAITPKPTSAANLTITQNSSFDSGATDTLKLNDDESIVPDMQTVTESNTVQSTIFCRECGFSYDKAGNFCPQCGTKNEANL